VSIIQPTDAGPVALEEMSLDKIFSTTPEVRQSIEVKK
jgi:hypothetical protein